MAVVTRTEAGRRSAVREWRRSGLDAATFASVLGVSVHTLYAWSRRFRAGASGRPASTVRAKGCGPGLVELVASGSTAQERGGSAGHGRPTGSLRPPTRDQHPRQGGHVW